MKQISIPGLANHDVAGIIFNTTHDSMFIMQVEPDNEFRCIEVNKAYLHNTRLKPEQVIGKTLKEILPEKACQTAYNGYKKAIETRQSVQYLEKVDFGFGEDVVETTLTPVFDASGTCTHLIGASRDIKKEKETEKALAETEERYRLLAEHASDSIALYDKNYKILYVSPSTEKLSGYAIAEILNQPFMAMIHKDDIETLKNKIALANQKNLNFQIYEYRYQRKDGQLIWVETSSTRIYDDNGNLFRIITVNRDITLRKTTEEILQGQKGRLEFLSASTTTMLHLPNVDAIYTYINQTIHTHFPETIVVTSIVNQDSKTTTLAGFTGIAANLLDKIKKITGFSLIGKVFNILSENEKIYRTGNFIEFEGGLPELVSSELPAMVSQAIQKIAGIYKVYAIGMNYDEKLLAILHVFTVNKSEISDSGFIETFLKQAGIVVQRKLLEEQLRFHSIILDQIHDRVTVTDLQGNITYVNKAVEQMFIKESNEFIGKSVKSYGENPEKGATQQEIIDKTLENGAWSGEIVNLAPDGTEHFMNVRTRILKNLNGEPIGMCGISTDITEQKKQEVIIKESEKRYQSLFDNMADGFSLNKIITDHNGKPVDWQFLMVNPAHEKQTGLKQEETIGKTIREIFPDVEQEWIDFYGQVALSGKSGKKISFNHNTGKYYEVNAFCPSPGNFAVVVNNITERIMAEKQLIQAKEKAEEDETKIRSMFENTLTGIMFATPEGKVLEANPAMLKIVGSPSLEVSRQLNLLEHEPLKQVGFADNLKKCIQQKTVISAETQYTSRFGKITYLKYFLIPIFVNEKNLGVWVNVHDLTDLWSVRNDLIVAKEKAEAADRLKTAFLNNISHEVRTPLNGILGFGDLITQPGLSAEKKDKYLATLNNSSNRLMQTITDYMDISLITSGNQEVVFQEMKPAQLIKTCFDDFQEKCNNKNLSLITQKPDDTNDDVLTTDAVLLQKALYHLVENAVKFTHSGHISIEYRKTGDEFEFIVSDTGVGISKQMLEAVFDNFVQEDTSSTRGYEGSGLGLSIVRGFANLLGGKIRVESEKGIGSTFYFTIPVSNKNLTHPNNSPDLPHNIKTPDLVILIVEDDESSFNYFDAILSRYNLTLLQAFNGSEAVTLCHERPDINLVLMDLKMPVMNGFEATRIIKKIRPTLPVIAQTAYALSGDEQRARQAGCDDYMTKPIRKKILMEKLKKFGFDEEKHLKE